MFAFVALALLSAQQVAWAAAPADMMQMDMDACMAETGTTYEEIMAWADGGDASENLKCMTKCMMLRCKTMTEDGHLILEAMLAKLPEEQHNIATQCVQIDQGGELCDLAYRHHKCMRDKSPQWYADWVKKMLPGSS
nr:odorant-binding protein [Odontothrips loti]